MEETDYREISQQYAQGAIRGVILVNGGAALAVLSQLASLSQFIANWVLGGAFLLFVVGVTSGLLCWMAAFVSTRHVDRTLRGQDKDYRTADRWMFYGEALLAFSIICFLVGSCALAVTFMC
ncbi:MAG: hypothetical protein OIF40_17405 [Mangrovicoccus sp.]|nr:hypothetical protein [Mangrovicoccus sp.]